VDKVLLACFCLGLSTGKAASVLAPVLPASHGTWTRRSVGYHDRALEDKYQYLFFDGAVLKSKGAVKVQKKILLCAFGITLQARHEMIDFIPQPVNRGRAGKRFYAICTKGGLREAHVS
jgi:transposase-like protein